MKQNLKYIEQSIMLKINKRNKYMKFFIVNYVKKMR